MKTLTTHLNENLQQNFVFKGNLKQSPYQPVDLGLSVKWCSCNVGASKPEDPGLLFQWGRTDGYKYDDKNHQFLSVVDYATKSDAKYKRGDTLKLEDDAVHVIIGDKWRMPTKEEIQELLTLPHKWTELNGVKGYEFTSENEKSIFIPAAGYFDNISGSFLAGSSECALWCSSIDSKFASKAYNLYFNFAYCDIGIPSSYCYDGYSVRGVC